MSPSTAPRAATLLGMFAKHWQPGKVKTRLAHTLGESHAAMLHALFVHSLVERFATVADRRVLAFAPAEAERAFASVSQGRWNLAVQKGGDLGERMQHFFNQTLAQANRVVLLGSDSPDLPRACLDEAFAALQSHEVVLGPSADGGYYLVGTARREPPPIFEDIAWSTPDVWTQTTARLRAAGIVWHELPQWYDVDTETDLRALANRLAAVPAHETRLMQLARELVNLLGPELRRAAKSHP